MKKKLKIASSVKWIFISIAAAIAVYPLLWMIIQSFKTDEEFYSNQFAVTLNPQFQNFVKAWNEANFAVYFKNSILVTSITVVLALLFCSMCAYAISKINFIGKKIWIFLIITALFLPSSMLQFPVYEICNKLGILGTRFGLIAPYLAGCVPVSTLIMMASLNTIPKEMMESANIDGCGYLKIYYRIMLPLIKPALATVCILQGMTIWNEYMWAMISLSDKNLYTIQVGLAEVAARVFNFGYVVIFAGMVMATLPVLLLYVLMQKQFVSAITSGAVKG